MPLSDKRDLYEQRLAARKAKAREAQGLEYTAQILESLADRENIRASAVAIIAALTRVRDATDKKAQLRTEADAAKTAAEAAVNERANLLPPLKQAETDLFDRATD